jgi:hypothetical protein
MKQAPYLLFAKTRLDTVSTPHSHALSSPSSVPSVALARPPIVESKTSLADCVTDLNDPYVTESGTFVHRSEETVDEKTDYLKLLRQIPLSKTTIRDVLCAQDLGHLTLTRHSSRTTRGTGWMDYHLRIVTVGTVSILSGTSVTNVYVSDPSAIPLSQWTTWASLFDEVKLDSLSAVIAPLGDPSKVLAVGIGSFPSTISNPSTLVEVVTGQNGKLLSPLMTKPHVQHMTISDLVYASTAIPSATAGAGCPGSIKLYVTGTTTGAVMTYQVVGVYHLRGRR